MVKRTDRISSATTRPYALLPMPSRPTYKAPPGFTSVRMDLEQREALNRIAVETFMSLANSGHSFADCLGSLLFTGMHFAVEATRGTE